MSFKRSTRWNPIVIPVMEEFERMLRYTEAPDDSQYYMAQASRDILVLEAEIMEVGTQSFEDLDG